MSTSDNPPSSRKAFAFMVFTGISASLIITIASFFVGFRYTNQEAHLLPQEWSKLPPRRSQHWTDRVLRYDANWNGVHAGSLRVQMKQGKTGRKIVSYEAQTTSRLSWAFHWKTKGTTWLDTETLLPRFACRHTTENDESQSSWTTFSRRHRRVSHLSVESDDETPDWSELHFIHGLDLPALFCQLCTSKLSDGEIWTFDVVEDGKAYAIHFTPADGQSVRMRGRTVPARKMTIISTPLISDIENDTSQAGASPTIDIWLHNDTHVPLKIRYSGILGNISVELATPISHADVTR